MTVQSERFGTLQGDGWEHWHSAPVAVPFYDGAQVAVTYNFIGPDDDPDFVRDADKAAGEFLKLDATHRLAASQKVADYAVICLDGWDYSGFDAVTMNYGAQGIRPSINAPWLNDFEHGKKPVESVWEMVGRLREIVVQRHDDGRMYVSVHSDCAWESHGLLLVFREGKELVRVSIPDGKLTD